MGDPYRVVFDHVSVGAARCRLQLERGTVVGTEVLDSNAAFSAFPDLTEELLHLFARAHAGGDVAKVAHRRRGLTLSVSAFPVAAEELIVLVEDVTPRVELERRSRASQDRFETAFHGNAAAMVIARQHDLSIVDVNPRWLEMFKATREEVIGKTSVELGLISANAATTRIAQHKVFQDGYDVELSLTTRTGVPLIVLASARPIEIAEGACTLTTLIDITGRKHAEEAFAAAFNSSPAGMLLLDAGSDTVISVNRRFVEMTSFDRDEIVGKRFGDLRLVHETSRAGLIAEVQARGRLDAFELELNRKDGSTIATLASTETITLNESKHRLSVFTDIAARKRVERRLLTQHEVGRSLAEATDIDAALPRVIETLCRDEGWDCGAIWLPDDVDPAGLRCRGTWHVDGLPAPVVNALAAVARAVVPGARLGVFGRVLATGTTEKTQFGPAVGPHGTVAFAAGMRRAIAFPILRGTEVLGVVGLTARDEGTPLDAEERGLFDAIGQLLGLFVERTRAQTSLRDLNLDLERRVLERTQALANSNRDLEAFSSSVSHDLRAPLRTIHAFSQVLLEDFAADLPEEAQKLLTRIHASGSRLRDLIADVLAFSQLGRALLRRTDIELEPMVRSVVDDLIAGRELDDRLDLRIHALGTCHADPALLRGVWQNLIDNALKYSRNQPRIEIEIGRESRGSEVVYFVKDNGAGFDMTYVDRLFGVFQRLHSEEDFEGTGVGLANVRRIVERHHGRVAATSELGRGSRFEFTLGIDPG